jgi:hypothetical protein
MASSKIEYKFDTKIGATDFADTARANKHHTCDDVYIVGPYFFDADSIHPEKHRHLFPQTGEKYWVVEIETVR